MSLAIVMVAAADFVGSATLVTVTVTVAGAGNTCGAVKVPAEIVPTELLPPAIPATLHVTAVFAVLPTTSASVTVSPSNTEPLVGVTATLIGTETDIGSGVVVGVVAPEDVRPHPLPSAARRSSRKEAAAPVGRFSRCTRHGWPKAMPRSKARRGPGVFLHDARAALDLTRQPGSLRDLSQVISASVVSTQ